MRFIDRCGRLDDIVASFEEASGAIGYAASGFSASCSLALFRRRCGSTSSVAAGAFALLAWCPLSARMAAIELCNSRLDLPKLSLSVEFAQK